MEYENREYKRYELDLNCEIQFFDYDDYQEVFHIENCFAWGVKLLEGDETKFFPICDYFDNTPFDLLTDAPRVVSEMADAILDWLN